MISQSLDKKFDDLEAICRNCTGKKRDELVMVLYDIALTDPLEAFQRWRMLVFNNLDLINQEMTSEKIRPMYLGPHLLPYRGFILLSLVPFRPALPLILADDEFMDILFSKYSLDRYVGSELLSCALISENIDAAEKYLSMLYNNPTYKEYGNLWNYAGQELIGNLRKRQSADSYIPPLSDNLKEFILKWISRIPDDIEKVKASVPFIEYISELAPPDLEEEFGPVSELERQQLETFMVLKTDLQRNFEDAFKLLLDVAENNKNAALGIRMLKSLLQTKHPAVMYQLSGRCEGSLFNMPEGTFSILSGPPKDLISEPMELVLQDEQLLDLLYLESGAYGTPGACISAALIQSQDLQRASQIISRIYRNSSYSNKYIKTYKNGVKDVNNSSGYEAFWREVFIKLRGYNLPEMRSVSEEPVTLDIPKIVVWINSMVDCIPKDSDRAAAEIYLIQLLKECQIQQPSKEKLLEQIEILEKEPYFFPSALSTALGLLVDLDPQTGYGYFRNIISTLLSENFSREASELMSYILNNPLFCPAAELLANDSATMDLVFAGDPWYVSETSRMISWLIKHEDYGSAANILNYLYNNKKLYEKGRYQREPKIVSLWRDIFKELGYTNGYRSSSELNDPQIKKETRKMIERIPDDENRRIVLNFWEGAFSG